MQSRHAGRHLRHSQGAPDAFALTANQNALLALDAHGECEVAADHGVVVLDLHRGIAGPVLRRRPVVAGANRPPSLLTLAAEPAKDGDVLEADSLLDGSLHLDGNARCGRRSRRTWAASRPAYPGHRDLRSGIQALPTAG